nr:unnamed protein product [Callosobruchus chinensis]
MVQEIPDRNRNWNRNRISIVSSPGGALVPSWGYSWYECNCCPYGYHIDLDFVRYCESISKEADSRTGSIKRRKDRRRQRQSMEVLLGLAPPILTSLEQHYQVIEEKNSPNITKTTTTFSFNDGFNDAVSDFEKPCNDRTKRDCLTTYLMSLP